MKVYWITFAILLGLSIFNEVKIIHRLGNYVGIMKFTYLFILYGILFLILSIKAHSTKDWILYLRTIPLSMSIWFLVKDLAMGIFLHKDWTYLGTGRWDRMFGIWPPALLLFFKVILIIISLGLYLRFNIIAFGIFTGILIILISTLFIKTRK